MSKPRDISVILGQISMRAEFIVQRFGRSKMPHALLSDLDDAQAIITLVEQAKAEILQMQLKASIKERT